MNKQITHTWEYYSAIERNGALIHGTTLMNLKNMLSERSCTQNTTNCIFYLYETFSVGKSIETDKWLPGARQAEGLLIRKQGFFGR